MADPLSVAGLAAGVVSLGIQVSQGITTYIDGLNCRSRDIALARQQNDCLQKTLQVVETLHSQLKRDHRDATALVRQYLDSCREELRALESLVVNLTACDIFTVDRADRIKNKGKKLLYPFNRPKLEQLELRLRDANGALQLALQILGLSVSQLGTERLATIQATSYNLSASFGVVQSEISALNLPLQGMHNTLSGFGNRLGSLENLLEQLLVQRPAINGCPEEITPAVAAGRLLAKPAVLRDICDATGVRAWPTSTSSTGAPAMNHGATPARFSHPVSTYTGGRLSCWCRHRRRLQIKTAILGSLALSLQTATEQHLPGCPATQLMIGTDRSHRVALTYTGLRHLLNSAVQLSFATSWGAGAWSLSPSFTYYPSVDSETAPAFRILTLVAKAGFDGALRNVELWEKLSQSAVSAILGLFRAKKASARAVDAHNRSLVYHLAACIAMASGLFGTPQLSSQAKPHPLLELLNCLLDNKAPAYHYDLSGHTSLSRLFTSTVYGRVTDPLFANAADLILRSNVESNVACLSTPVPAIYSSIVDRSGRVANANDIAVLLHFLGSSTGLADAYGCGPLSLAILSNNLEQVEHLVKNHPATLAEQNLFGHTPLHLAADKPSCLRLLVGAADARLLNQTDRPYESGISALETAVFLSQLRCRETTNRRLCQGCSCDETAAILLEADCALPVFAHLQTMLSYASKRCKLRYIRCIKDRRDRLKQLALYNLPARELEQLGLTSKDVLDSAASRVIELLEDRGIGIPEALAATRNLHGPSSVYQALCLPSDAEHFFSVGFHDTDSWCNADAAELENLPTCTHTQALPYLHWLATHRTSSCQFMSFETGRKIFVANLTFWRIGKDLDHWPGSWIFNRIQFHGFAPEFTSDSESLPLTDRIAWIREVNAAVLPAEIADTCRCKCSPRGCTPMTSLLKGMPGLWDYTTYAFSEDSADTDFSGDSPADSTDCSEDSVTGDTDSADDESEGIRGSLSLVVTDLGRYLELFGADLDIRHHNAVLRCVTFTTLGIPHTCCDPDVWRWLDRMTWSSEEEAEIEDEHAYELELLEELLGEFEGQVTAILQDPNQGVADVIRFWKRTWMRRMKEVLARLHGNDLADDEKRGAEEVGVVWDRPRPPKVRGNPYRRDTLDHWLYELEEIKAECQ